MKNLQSFGVQEMSSKEIREVEGGFLGCLCVCLAVLYLAGSTAGIAMGNAPNGTQ